MISRCSQAVGGWAKEKGGLCITQTVSFSPWITPIEGYSDPLCFNKLLKLRSDGWQGQVLLQQGQGVFPSQFAEDFTRGAQSSVFDFSPTLFLALWEKIVSAECNEAQKYQGTCMYASAYLHVQLSTYMHTHGPLKLIYNKILLAFATSMLRKSLWQGSIVIFPAASL